MVRGKPEKLGNKAMMEFTDVVLVAVVTGIASGAASWGATAVHLKWLRRDVDDASKSAKRAHSRIDAIISRPGGKRDYDPPAPADLSMF
jgi:hypothetical protein